MVPAGAALNSTADATPHTLSKDNSGQTFIQGEFGIAHPAAGRTARSGILILGF